MKLPEEGALGDPVLAGNPVTNADEYRYCGKSQLRNADGSRPGGETPTESIKRLTRNKPGPNHNLLIGFSLLFQKSDKVRWLLRLRTYGTPPARVYSDEQCVVIKSSTYRVVLVFLNSIVRNCALILFEY